MKLTILSGGAANGLVSALSSQFKAETGADIDGTFGAVGAMRDKLVGGASADLLILTSALIAELTKAGHVVAGSAADLGAVATGVAVRSGDPAPAIGDADALRAALRAADGIYFPDPRLATAGIHFAKVLERLGIAEEVAPRLRTFPNGQTAMAALAAQRRRPADRLHADHRDPQHQGGPAGREPADRVRPLDHLHRSASAPRRSPPILRAASPPCSPARARATCAASSASAADPACATSPQR